MSSYLFKNDQNTSVDIASAITTHAGEVEVHAGLVANQLAGITGKAANKMLAVNAQNTGFEWIVPPHADIEARLEALEGCVNGLTFNIDDDGNLVVEPAESPEP